MTEAQSLMLRHLHRAVEREKVRHGADNGWIELGGLVMDEAPSLGPDSLAWRNANRVFGALERKGMIERHATCDDLIRPSATALNLLEWGTV